MYQNNGKNQKRGNEKMEATSRLRRVAFYHLVSPEDKAEYVAGETNISELEKQVGRLCGLEPYSNYIDDFGTGTTAKQKPEFMKMIKDAEGGKFDLIFADDLLTFSTDIVEAVNYCRLLKKMNVECVFFGLERFSTFEKIAEPLLDRMKNFALTHDYMGRTAAEIRKERGFRK